MKRLAWRIVAGITALSFAGCGGSGGSGSGGATPPNPPSAGGTTVTATFTGSAQPLAVATATGSGALTVVAPSGGKVTLTVPKGSTTYAIAYHCPLEQLFGTVDVEYLVEASIKDTTAPSLSCMTIPTNTSTTSVAVDASAIPGATGLALHGNDGYGGTLAAATGTVSASFIDGTNDIAALALNASSAIVGVKIVRDQTIPGSVSAITFAASDATTTSTCTVPSIPSGFNASPAMNLSYVTANQTNFIINTNTTPTTYAVVPASEAAAGDYYVFSSNTADLATDQNIGTTTYVSASTPPGPQSLTFPTPWSYTGPTAAEYPTFTFAYTGFTGMASVVDQAAIGWTETGTSIGGDIVIQTTPNALGTATTMAIPNLTGLAGFITSMPASGTSVSYNAIITGSTAPAFSAVPQSTGTQSWVQLSKSYTEP